jgi:hypothetical protein
VNETGRVVDPMYERFARELISAGVSVDLFIETLDENIEKLIDTSELLVR